MRQTPTDRNHPTWFGTLAGLAACALAIGLGPDARAQVRAPGPESFAVQPKTPEEFWDAAEYLVRVGQAAQAVPYLDAFLKSNPDDDTLVAIRDKYGIGSVLRLADDPATSGRVDPLLKLFAGASRRRATDPARLDQLARTLTKSREEQRYAIDQLKLAGPHAVPALIRVLIGRGVTPEERAQTVGNMGQLDRSAVPALIAGLDAPDPLLAADMADVLGRIGDRRAIPDLTARAATGDDLAPIRESARDAIARLTGRPFGAQPVGPARLLADEAWKYHHHAVNFPGDPIELWRWDGGGPAPYQVSRADAESTLGLERARQALAIDPTDLGAQVALVSLALEQASRHAGNPAAVASTDPDGSYAAAMAAGPEVLTRVLRTAMDDGHGDLAALAAAALGRVAGRDLNTVGRRPEPLVEALGSPDRRVQFAAAHALLAMDPPAVFPGSSRVVPVLARFVTNRAPSKAVVIDSNPARGSQATALLREVGYDPVLAPTGPEGFRQAAGSADVELILLEPSLFDGAWTLGDTLANLRADARTAGIPVLIVGPLALHPRLEMAALNYPKVGLLVTPTRPDVLRQQLDRALTAMGARPLSDEERAAYARAAARLLAQVASKPNSPFAADLPAAGSALMLALNTPAPTPETNVSASTALAEVPRVDAQRALADAAIDPGRPASIRLNAAYQLARSIQRFGPLLTDTQERRLVEELDQAADPNLRSVLASVVGALGPDPAQRGRRLPAAVPVPAPGPQSEAGATPPAAPAEVPAPEEPSFP